MRTPPPDDAKVRRFTDLARIDAQLRVGLSPEAIKRLLATQIEAEADVDG